MKKFQEFVEILREFDNLIENSELNVEINDISYDSREIKDGTLFFCKGLKFKDEYLEDAKIKGASSYISERKMNVEMPYILVKDVRKAMMQVARFFYDYPDKKIKTIGVTGTKGKSSTVKYIKSIFDRYLEENGKKPAGLISTINTFDGIDDFESSLSTPEALMLYKYLYNAVNSGLEYMIIESSSQAFKYYRMNNLELDVAVFLNIGEDHVSDLEHSSFEDYFESKLKIFNNAKFSIYNKDSDFVERIEDTIIFKNTLYESFSAKKDANLVLKKFEFIENGLRFNLNYKNQDYDLSIHQFGTYNIENVMAAFLVAKHFNIDDESIEEGIKNTIITGREEFFESDDKKVIMFVSYAHNELSFDKSYEFIKEKYKDYKIISVFGNSGKMAKNRIEGTTKSAGKNSDFIIIVPEDSAYTPYEKIYQAMFDSIKLYNDNFDKRETREEGIKFALEMAKDKTVIFIAGKGDEKYQKENGKYIPIKSDVDVARELIEKYNKK